jgi:hypothetical protein
VAPEIILKANLRTCKSPVFLKIGMRTIDRIKQRYLKGGIERALERAESGRIYRKKVDEDLKAKIVRLYGSEPPEGFAGRSFRLLAEKVMESGYTASISHVTVYQVLKKSGHTRGKVRQGSLLSVN